MNEPALLPKLTYEDYLGFPDDGKRHEIVDGEHFVNPAPFTAHQRIAADLFYLLRRHLADSDAGEVLFAPVDVVLSPVDVVQPDLLFVSRENLSALGERNLEGAPDLVVEILSDSTRRLDEITKRDLYARNGVREYWVVDPILETVKVYRAGEAGFERVALLHAEEDDRLSTPLLPGLEIPLTEIF